MEADNYFSDLDVGNVLSYDLTEDIADGTEVFVRVVPYNENGDAGSCTPQKFSVEEDFQFCEPFFDSAQGGLVKRRPEIDFPKTVAVCRDNLPSSVSIEEDGADGFRWFKMNDDGSETLLSEISNVSLSDVGRYRIEAFNNIPSNTNTIECSDSKEFDVIFSEAPIISSIGVQREGDTRQLTVNVVGAGSYEFAIDNPEGPYQSTNVFRNVEGDVHTLYVRDSNGCGTASREAPRDLSRDNFPNFFTPNADSTNDTWQFIVPKNAKQIGVETIYIFDRYGNLLAQMDPKTKGWDGNFRGRPLPSSTYWYKSRFVDRRRDYRLFYAETLTDQFGNLDFIGC